VKVFVAKQPVYNTVEEVIGYDLLYRKDSKNIFPSIDGDLATAEVIINTYLNIGLERLNEGKFLCFQFTERLLEQRLPTYFNPNDVVIKISREVVPTKKLMKIMQELKELGFIIAVNEHFFAQDFLLAKTFLPYIDIIEVDFRNRASKDKSKIEKMARECGIKLLAQKIETKEQFVQAKERGYSCFGGYFFSEPLIESAYELPLIFSSTYHSIQDKVLEEDELADMIEKDLSFSIKLLRLLNISTHHKQKICSIREAISILGVEEIRKWMELLAASYVIREERQLSEELTIVTLTRAKLCELIARQIEAYKPSCYYLLGLISAIEKINSDSMEAILQGLPLQDEMYEALQGKENHYRLVLDLVEAVESANWKGISNLCNRMNLTERDLFRIYAESLNWTKKMIQKEKIENGNASLLALLTYNSL
jgi:c-di-GMP-related signal transduction protein